MLSSRLMGGWEVKIVQETLGELYFFNLIYFITKKMILFFRLRLDFDGS